ncbi:MAG: SsrA-binding protein SmpB [Candidatus Pacebacteria bacterium]|nr:SsrA-binding protein SmpB [Candidatus Paceibacterota bacterium]
MQILAKNRKAQFNYEIVEKFEAGIQLLGCEVKSVKAGNISLDGAFVQLYGNELYLINASIPAWQPANAPADYKPDRSRKLLLHRKEIDYLIGKMKAERLMLIPLAVYLKKNKIKLELGLARSRKKVDKRELIKEREAQRELERRLKNY